ncbi:uncharacterized protein FOMMEDRAFT_144332 [Fomitiporia mediterranea MF3/22]|uniref:uncharacterized protein n=1 Tax=Fomitiporia mediterranea (strain MF3/22) TaxID=694068 RepID=UPI0004409342|nr:uncharacterized protein FOMMEDRAFT_144332 [Fomitiporia mediterranea MF3/22]EJD08447.1 hypothetical protein FOMMEDRAFT_144332 [Fomitiporia mediterranea MF3/22]
MSSATQDSQTKNSPHPYGTRDVSAPGASANSSAGVQSPVPETHGVVAAAGASRADVGSGQNVSGQGQSPAPSQTLNSSQSRSGQKNFVDGQNTGTGSERPAEEEGGAARGSGTGACSDTGAGPEGGYPKQLHAGKLEGRGPEYWKMHGVTIGERLQGVREEIKGTIKHDPELKKTGKERMTGELKRKQLDEGSNADPFNTAGGDSKSKDDKEEEEGNDSKKTRTERTDEPGLTENPQAHPTDKGREEQAASVQPEGTGSMSGQSRAKENAASGLYSQ